jgi:ribosomal peptide maturation radical SAM protein 1
VRVLLVNPPWASCGSPSIQCGLLKAGLQPRGHEVSVRYLNLRLAAQVGLTRYEAVSSMHGEREHMLGEWLFGKAAFGDQPEALAMYERFPELGEQLEEMGLSWSAVTEWRDALIPDWTASQARLLASEGADVLMFTSTFLQTCSGFALGRAVKRLDPAIVSIYGGANFESTMGEEFARCCDWIDYVVTGEGDQAIQDLLSAIENGEARYSKIAGVCCRDATTGAVVSTPAVPVESMDNLPTPDYDDYFAQAAQVPEFAECVRPVLPIQMARGCWWGAKHQCTFCGLNGTAIGFRRMSPERALQEVRVLLSRYRIGKLYAVDNIFDLKFVEALLPRLMEEGWDLDLFLEVKTNMTRAQIGALALAGVRHVQPGIESLSSPVLSLMSKGSTMLTNICFLKWASYYGISCGWNILTGFPGERITDYEDQVALIPYLWHLEPPGHVGRIWLERFSPNYEEHRFTNVRPREAYRMTLGIEGLVHERVAYFFEYDRPTGIPQESEDSLKRACDEWTRKRAEQSMRLEFENGPDWLRITDARCRPARAVMLEGWRAAVYRACSERPRHVDSFAKYLRDEKDRVPKERVVRFLSRCQGEGLVVSERDWYLGLAVPRRASLDYRPRLGVGTGSATRVVSRVVSEVGAS